MESVQIWGGGTTLKKPRDFGGFHHVNTLGIRGGPADSMGFFHPRGRIQPTVKGVK